MEGTKLDLKRAQIDGDNYGPSDVYTDKVECVPFALAALIIMYVEDEKGGPNKLKESIEWRMRSALEDKDEFSRDSSKLWATAEERILQLYKWWTVERPKLMNRESELLEKWSKSRGLEDTSDLENRLNAPDTPRSRELFEAHTDLGERIRAEMQEFCHGVIDIREFLWT